MDATLQLVNDDGSVTEFRIEEEVTYIGRSRECQIQINSNTISRRHAYVQKLAGIYQVVDLGSSNGTTLNDTPLIPHQPQTLAPQDVIKVDIYPIRFVIAVPPITNTVIAETVEYQDANIPTQTLKIDFSEKTRLTIGRDASNDLVINHPAVSSFHALLIRSNEAVYITDLQSRNGTFVNGRRISGRKVLDQGDWVRIASYTLVLNPNQSFTPINESGNLRLDALDLNQVVIDANTKRKRKLLNNVSLSVLAREFIIIAGVSGGGKSTLMDALSGFRPASSGTVFVNGIDLYKNYDAYRNEIGYVPQQDIVHTDLTVYQALSFSARLRMPADTTSLEREKRIDQVLTELKLIERKHTTIANLSGGQKKRVSIALELLTQPSLFFLDEATSGLDPATDAEVMQILREIANSGKTVLLITHATENIKVADMVLFLAKNGNVAYWGRSQEIQSYFAEVGNFNIQSFSDIYRLVEKNSTDQHGKEPEDWQRIYTGSSLYQNYVVSRQRQLNLHQQGSSSVLNRPSRNSSSFANISPFSQFLILLERNFLLLFRDRISTLLVLVLTPILGLLDLGTWKSDLFDSTTGNAGQAITMLFNFVLVAIIAGCLSTMREIIKEADIYKRERATGLQISPYVLSKIFFCGALAVYQSATLLLFKYFGVAIPGSLVLYYAVLFASSLSGMTLGLLVSAIAPNQNVAPLLAIVFLIPQITFGGGVLPVNSLTGFGRIANHLSLTKWTFESLVTISGLGRDVANDSCWRLSKSERDNLSESEQSKRCSCLGKNAFVQCQFPSIKENYDPSVDEPEPVQPRRPRSPGAVPSDPRDFSAYEEEVNNFNRAMGAWETNMEQWRERFGKWKEKREGAIGSAKGLIQQIQQDYGQAFAVNIWQHLQVICLQIAVMVGTIFVLQKRKDTL
jgi:ABC-type multidrug transport system ATPase subunit